MAPSACKRLRSLHSQHLRCRTRSHRADFHSIPDHTATVCERVITAICYLRALESRHVINIRIQIPLVWIGIFLIHCRNFGVHIFFNLQSGPDDVQVDCQSLGIYRHVRGYHHRVRTNVFKLCMYVEVCSEISCAAGANRVIRRRLVIRVADLKHETTHCVR